MNGFPNRFSYISTSLLEKKGVDFGLDVMNKETSMQDISFRRPDSACDWVKNTAVYRLRECSRSEIHRHKWIESEKLGYDIGWPRAERDWNLRYGRAFREQFLRSSQPS